MIGEIEQHWLRRDFDFVIYFSDPYPYKSELWASLNGPANSPYAGRRFMVRFQLETFAWPYYPFTAPTICFMTPIWHPNVTNHGFLDYDEFSPDEWSPITTLHDVLEVVHVLLSNPALGRTY